MRELTEVQQRLLRTLRLRRTKDPADLAMADEIEKAWLEGHKFKKGEPKRSLVGLHADHNPLLGLMSLLHAGNRDAVASPAPETKS